jgi:endopeptidase La
MTSLTRDLVINFLKKDYKMRSEIATNLSLHVEKLYDNYIIGTDEKKKIQKSVSELINMINKLYNNIVIKVNDEDLENTETKENESISYQTDDNIKKSTIKNINIESLMECYELQRAYKININSCLKFNNFKNIDIHINLIANDIGLGTFDDILYLYYSPIYKKLLSEQSNKILFFLNKVGIPLSVSEEVNNTDIKNKTDYVKINYKNDSNEKYEMLLDNLYTIKIFSHKFNKTLNIVCYFDLDSINTISRTCQICYDFIYEIKKEIIECIEKITSINKNFKNIYIKNLSYGDILCLNNLTIKKKLSEDYQKYIKYSGMSFKIIMKEFLEVDFRTKFSIIKFLLMGQENSINVAGLLFGLTKDCKDSKDNKSKPTLVSEIIYKNLNYPQQIKLQKSNVLIKQELEKLKSLNFEDIDLKKQIIANKNMPQYVKKIAIDKLEEMKSGSSEYYKQMQYVKILVDFPWIGNNDEDIFSSIGGDLEKCKSILKESREQLDKKVYGHDECKDIITELLGKWFTNPKSLGKAIGLVGPPGVGKTLFAKALGDVLKIPFTQINVGGVEDGSVLSGHSFTYSGAQPGIILRKMIEAGNPRCIMFFDELDKASTKHGINEVFNILMHVTDPNSNTNFNDKFFQEVTFPLNKVLFVFSFNDTEKVDKILLDRMELIDVAAYNMEDKTKIVKDYILEEIIRGVGIDNESIKIDDDNISYIVESFTFEAGVRDLKRKLETILLKLNLDRIYGKEPFINDIKFSKDTPIYLTKELIDKYLKKPKINIKKVHSTDEIGVINGLYATTNGAGGIIPILIYKHHMGNNKFELKLTGSQGKVMKESVQFAFTIAMNMLKDGFITSFIDNNPCGLHIHTPDGATPKDGPSAGAAFTTAFISRMLGKKIKHNIAMTGEIELNGHVTAIGGLEYKLMGAKRAGVNLVFVPKENEEDYKKITDKNKTLIDDNFKIIIIDHISEILTYALIDDKIVSKLKKGTDITYEKTFNNTEFLDFEKNLLKVNQKLTTKKPQQKINKKIVDVETEHSNSATTGSDDE